jgi:uncharacterized damage-inducible protein DinB
MEWNHFVARAFEYDRWANHQWLDSLQGFKKLERPLQVLEHILDAQLTWLVRCGAVVGPQRVDMPLKELFDYSVDGWLQLVDSSEFEDPITYRNSRGEEFTQPFGHIALHVVNHGTYHRGQLRGLAESNGYKDFPDTDLIFFLREQPV